MPQRKQKVKKMKAEAKKEKAAAAGANCENAEARTEEVERMCKGIIMSDSVVTENETGGRAKTKITVRPTTIFSNTTCTTARTKMRK